MEAGNHRLANAPDRASGGAHNPYFAPIERWFAATDPRPRGALDLGALNDPMRRLALHTASGKNIRFVDARLTPRGPYERIVYETGCVPTRTSGAGMLHDWLNALAWLAFPSTKSRLNALHVQGLDEEEKLAGVAGESQAVRGRLRDRATLFDESGAVFVCSNARLRDAFVARDWQTLFVREREAFARDASVVVFGHALFEKLLDPYKSLCAHAMVLAREDAVASGGVFDAALAAHLRADSLMGGALRPLPLLGVPGWCDANADPGFYDDAIVFRRERRRPG